MSSNDDSNPSGAESARDGSEETAVVCPGCGKPYSPFNPRCPSCGLLFSMKATGDAGDLGDPRTGRALTQSVVSPLEPPHTGLSEAAPARGGKLGRFEVTGALGAGTMGVVVRARDPLLGREVAIKVIRGEALGFDPAGARARLVREAQAMAMLKHPNVVAVYEVDASGGEVLVVMEHVEGRTLRAFCADERRPVADVLRTFVEAGRGLAAVHRAGLVHRDFKPENVLVDAKGRSATAGSRGEPWPWRLALSKEKGQAMAGFFESTFAVLQKVIALVLAPAR